MTRRVLAWLLMAFMAFAQVLAQAQETEPAKAAVQPAPVVAPPLGGAERLKRAGNLLEYGDYPALVGLLEEGVAAGVFAGPQLAEVHRLLGIGYFVTKRPEKAREAFLAMLLEEPGTVLDPLYVPPEIIDFVERIRRENQATLAALLAQRSAKGGEDAKSDERARTKILVRERKPLAGAFIPLGVGQFMNGDDLKGGLFCASELALLALNVSAYFTSGALRGADGYYSKDNARLARRWRTVQYAALGAFGAVAIGGIIDAVLSLKANERRALDEERRLTETERDAASEGAPPSAEKLKE